MALDESWLNLYFFPASFPEVLFSLKQEGRSKNLFLALQEQGTNYSL